ncbi:MAG: Mov34/MPN/PAD-1 family protein [Bryocella sp.]
MSQQQSQSPLSLQLEIDSEVTRRIRQHARSSMATEVCGVLIGEERDGTVVVQASIEASNAAQAGTHVTFTQDAWEEIYRVKDESYPDERIVGWYHSHPGFGVFLSEHDTFIHRNFFSSPQQVAWVYDPHTDEEGCFGWINGEIQRIPSLHIVDNSGDGEERTPKDARDKVDADDRSMEASTRTLPPLRRKELPAWANWLISGASYLAAALLGFLICFFLFPSIVGVAVDPITMQVMSVEGRPVIVGHVQFEKAFHPVVLPAAPVVIPTGSRPTVSEPQTAQPEPAQPQPAAKSNPAPKGHP